MGHRRVCELWDSANQPSGTCKKILGRYENIRRQQDLWRALVGWCAATLARHSFPLVN
jgi:hypothetical protein